MKQFGKLLLIAVLVTALVLLVGCGRRGKVEPTPVPTDEVFVMPSSSAGAERLEPLPEDDWVRS